MDKRITLECGDCLEVMQGIPDNSVDMVLCDLPYGNTRNAWDRKIDFERLWTAYRRVVKPTGAIILFGSGRFTCELMQSNPKEWRYNLIWEKSTPTGFLNANRMPLRSHEDILVFYRKLPVYHPIMSSGKRKVSTVGHKRNCKSASSYGKYEYVDYDSDTRYPKSVLHFSSDKQKSALHPTQKPVALLEYLIRMYTDENALVLDNCMGSGSTCIACMRCGRRFVGIELDPQMYDVAANRVQSWIETEGGTAWQSC